VAKVHGAPVRMGPRVTGNLKKNNFPVTLKIRTSRRDVLIEMISMSNIRLFYCNIEHSQLRECRDLLYGRLVHVDETFNRFADFATDANPLSVISELMV